MDQEQTKTLSLRAAYQFAAQHDLQQDAEKIQMMPIDWNLKTKSSVRRGYIVDLFERHGLFEAFKEQYWSNGKTPDGERRRKRYCQLKTRYDDFLAGRGVEDTTEDTEEDAESDDNEQQFAVEPDLRNFLANNLAVIEPGLKLYQEEKRNGVEYPIDEGRIDILAVDRENKFVVIELKVSRGRNKTVGQLLYYMGWVDDHLAKGPCRGMIIAREISDDLVVAVQRVPGVSLFRYRISASVEPVSRQPKDAAKANKSLNPTA